MEQQSRFRDFIRAFWPNLFALMSGGPSVPAAMLALYVDAPWAKIALWVTAFICLVLSAYFVWRPERRKVIKLTDKTTPKIKLTFDPLDIGCVRPDVTITFSTGSEIAHVKAIYYRAKVEATTKKHVHNCRGRVVSITKNGKIVVAGESLIVTFAPAENPDSTDKSVYEEVSEYLDFLAILENNTISITTKNFVRPSTLRWEEIFQEPANYVFELAVTSPDTVTASSRVCLDWTGDWRTAKVLSCP